MLEAKYIYKERCFTLALYVFSVYLTFFIIYDKYKAIRIICCFMLIG